MKTAINFYATETQWQGWNRCNRFPLLCIASKFLPFIAPEGAETAMQLADVAAVEIAIDDVGDRVTHESAPQRIGTGSDHFSLVSVPAALQQGQCQSWIQSRSPSLLRCRLQDTDTGTGRGRDGWLGRN